MGFVMDGLDKEGYDREYRDSVLVRRILGYFRPHVRTMTGVGVLVALTSLMETSIRLSSRVVSISLGQQRRCRSCWASPVWSRCSAR
jgi:hypothetical protein